MEKVPEGVKQICFENSKGKIQKVKTDLQLLLGLYNLVRVYHPDRQTALQFVCRPSLLRRGAYRIYSMSKNFLK